MITTLAARLTGTLGLKIAVGLAIALLLSMGGNWLLWGWWQAEVKAVATKDAELTTCASTNAGEQTTINDLTTKLADCVGQGQKVESLADAIDEQFNDMQAEWQRERANLRQARERSYASPSCAALRTVPVCRDRDDRLRSLEAGSPDQDD